MNKNDNALAGIFTALEADAQLWQDFLALCDCGGREAGSASERKALQIALEGLRAIDTGARGERVSYAGWRCTDSSFSLESGQALACNPLLGAQSTPAEGSSAEVVDLGRGTREDFERERDTIAGRFVLVRHEYPFAADHVHRRRKYGWAMERGAAGYIIANPVPAAGAVAGSSGRGGQAGIPAIGTDFESAARLARSGSARPCARMKIVGEDYAAETDMLTLDLRGQDRTAIVLSAHVDGHALAESAMDNATGVAVALAVARSFARIVANCARTLKVCFFSAEEWALAGSRDYLERMDANERAALALNINLDTVGGDGHLTALTSEFPALDPFVLRVSEQAGIPLSTYQPLMQNSDHYNFARFDIPALRLVAGFNRPHSNVRHILTGADTRDKVARQELVTAAKLTAALLWQALNAGDQELARLKQK